jgi:uncharacterized membrane protein YidH (DUF202 family)
MKIRNERDFWAGLMFIAFGLFFALFAQNYELGTAQRMGPGYFPTLLGALLALIGVIVAAQGIAVRTTDGKVEPFHLGPLLWVLGAVAAFGALLRPAGLVVSLAVLIAVASLGSHESRVREVVPIGIGISVLVLVVFIWGLGLTIPVWPAFLGR